MKTSLQSMLSLSAFLAGALADSKYNLRITSSSNSAIQGSVLAARDNTSATTTNPLGIWSTGEPRYAYEFTLSPSASNSSYYAIKSTVRQTQLTLYGDSVAEGLYDVPIGTKLTPKTGEEVWNDRWMFLDQAGSKSLRNAYDYLEDPTPHGGASSWRACKLENGYDYQVYWYDGMSELKMKDCEGVQLELVPASGTPTVSSPTGSASGSGAIGLPSPTGNASSSGSAKPTPSQYQGSAARVGIIGGSLGLVAGIAALAI